ncbi:MAG: hypothetical protein FGM55_13020 [Rhodoferax sp.]|nr:hypothetical protein [Rhodoferax sp.]
MTGRVTPIQRPFARRTVHTAIELQALGTAGDGLPRPHGNCYWLLPGALLAGQHPLAAASEPGQQLLDRWIDHGVRSFVDLTRPDESLPGYPDAIERLSRKLGTSLGYARFPIQDYGVPSQALMRQILAHLYQQVAQGRCVYLHCHGGIGRTGTVVGCLLRDQGLSATEAQALIATKWLAMEKRNRHPESPETQEQRDFIANWPGPATLLP